MTAKHCVSTTAGARQTNQDRAFAEPCTVSGQPALVLAVADGMGGMQSGDRAAEIAIETVRRHAKEVLPSVPDAREALRQAIGAMFQEANRRIWEFGQNIGAEGGVGTTLAFCLTLPGRYLIANVGDSRCYYINNWEARQLTEDHSRVQDLVRMGSMTPEAAKRSPYRNELTNSLGEPEDVQVDVFPVGANYGIIDEDCVLLLCSDGLHGEVTEQDIFQQLHGTKVLASGCANLLSLAFRNGSTDNITVAAAEFGRLARKQRRVSLLPAVEVLIRERRDS
jgi:PPM family protein phosphatase